MNSPSHRLAAVLATAVFVLGSLLAVPAARVKAASAPAAPAKTSPVHAAHAASAPARAGVAADAPFWTGRPNAAAFRRIQEARIAKARALLAQLTAVKGTHTIANTLTVYDGILQELDAAGAQAGLMEEVHPDSAMRATAEKMDQEVSSFATEFSLNRKAYAALAALDTSGADATTRFYVWRELRDFRLQGVDKDDATRARIKALRDELVLTGQEFSRNIREDHPTVVVSSAAELEGLPQDWIDAHPADPSGKITLSIEYPDYFPVMTYAKREDLRRRMYMAFQNRAYPKNMAVLDSLIAKRYRLAQLLGFPNWAEYFAADKMSGSAKNASDFIDKVVQASGDRMKADFQVLLDRKRKDVPGATGIDWWDRFYWTQIVKKEKYEFDAQALRPYFPYQRVKQGVLDVTSRMFGVTYRQVKNAPVWDPSVECWEMLEGNKLKGRFYLDMHPRHDKFNHAAQFGIRTGVEGKQLPEAALICNLPGGEPGDPGLCEMEDVTTFFHEFGHLLHDLFAGHQRWVGIGGIRTEHDFVEAPSQMLEEWMKDPAVLGLFARHYQSGEAIPAALVAQLNRAEAFGDLDPRGIDVRRQMVLARLSLSIYDRPPSQVNTDALNKRLTNTYTPYPYVEDTHFQCSFGHLDGYSAGYYTYMWSLVIAKDMFTKFNKANLLDPTIATRYRDIVLAPGGSRPAAQLVESFLGRPFGFEAYRAWLGRTPESMSGTP